MPWRVGHALNVLIQMLTDQKGAQGFPIFAGGRKGIGPIELEVVVAGHDDFS